MTATAPEPMRTVARPTCVVCGGGGDPLYEGLTDRVWLAAGTWRLRRCRGAGCGTLWLDPAPAPEDLHHAYRAYYTHGDAATLPAWALRLFAAIEGGYLARRYGYEAAASGWRRALGLLARLHPGLPPWFDLHVMYLPAARRGRLLDVGCGDGGFLAGMRRLGWQVEGVEPDPASAELARGHGLAVRTGTLAADSFAAGSFDAVTLNHVVEHLPDPLAQLEHCRRFLADAGCLVMTTPNAESWGHRRFGRDWLSLDPPRHLNLFTVRSLSRLGEAAGFRVVDARTNVRNVDGVVLASRRLRARGRYEWGRLGSPATRLAAQFLNYTQRARLAVRPEQGEELVLVLAKA